jgi:hypothetical protein
MCCEGIPAGQNIETTDPIVIWNSLPYRQLRQELESGKVRKKCWNCPLIQPTTNDESALYQGFLTLTSSDLSKEIMKYKKYIDGYNERSQAAEQKCTPNTASVAKYSTEINDLEKSLESIMEYAVLLERVAIVETTLSSLTKSAKAGQGNDSLIQECIKFFNALSSLIKYFQNATSIFPGLNRIVKEMVKATPIIEQILRPISLCNDLDKVNQIISEPLIKALEVWPEIFMQSKNEMKRQIETLSNTLFKK